MYNTIQDILTYLIEAITIIGFCGCWLHYSLLTALNEVASWENHEFIETLGTNESQIATEIEQPQNATPTFQGYSKARLRKIARELQIRRYSRMEASELIAAIATHPEAQKISA